MKITHCISSIDESTGGPARSVTHLVVAFGEIDKVSEINLLTLESENPLLLKFSNTKLLLKFYNSGFMEYSYQLANKLDSIQSELFHIHGIWQIPVHQMAKSARQRKIPYVISTRGMLEPWSLEQSKIKKKLAMLLFQHKDLKEASCLHATALMEVESIRKLGFKNPIACIPNGINIGDFPQKKYAIGKAKKTILFLSRIHPKKGIEILIDAWQSLDYILKEKWCIQIAGNGEEKYIKQLNSLIEEKGLAESITIIGPKFGPEKIATYHEADLFVLPTHSENFGIVIAEALCCGVPVITTKGTPWEVLERYNAGKWVAVGESPLKEALEHLMRKTDAEREAMGKNGRKLIEENYSIESVAERFILLYQWILNGGKKPDFVQL
jgi:glycosyltransferase involved in cell wall biosynthesis